ncbi:MAG: hypothetical protein PHR82_05965 [Endomicrobiaceae bacterium]|nr:hypothetical protein [Endomicrobiaceae bacterium]
MFQKYKFFLLIILAYLAVFSFYPALSANFVNLDDTAMVINNQYVKDLSINNITAIFSNYHYRLYHPVVIISYAIEYYFFKLDPFIYHLTNILLHLLNTFLVFFVFKKLTKSFTISYIVSVLFAVHPVHVEVVAWISSRKDLLYSIFYLLSILFYLKISETKNKTKMFMLSLFFFTLSCLSKPMAITLPFILALIDYHKNNLTIKKIKNYIPFICISLVFVVVTIFGYYSVEQKNTYTLYSEIIYILNTHYNILFYLFNFIYPVNLSCLYPFFYNQYTNPPFFVLYSPVLLYIIFLFVLLSLKFNKRIFFGFMFFIITLLPSSGIMPTGMAPIADRYVYLPYIGLFYLFAEFAVWVYTKIKIKILLYIISVLLVSVLVYLSYARTTLWQDTKNLMTDAIKKYPDKANHAYLIRGMELKLDNKLSEAEADFKKSFSISKNSPYTIFNLAHLAQLKKNYNEAKKGYMQIPRDSPDYISAMINLALIMHEEGHTDKAISFLEKIRKSHTGNYNSDLLNETLASFYFAQYKDTKKTIEYLQKAISINPYKEQYYLFIMYVYEQLDDFENLEKIAFEGLENLGIKNSINILNFIGIEYFKKSDLKNAEFVFNSTLADYPNNHIAYFFLGNIYALKHQYNDALTYYTMAILLTNENGEYYFKRSAVHLMLNNYKQAKEDMEKSLKKGFNIDINFKNEIEKIKN